MPVLRVPGGTPVPLVFGPLPVLGSCAATGMALVGGDTPFPAPAVQRVALAITTLLSFPNSSFRRPSAMLIGAAARLTRRCPRPEASIQYTASGIACVRIASAV